MIGDRLGKIYDENMFRFGKEYRKFKHSTGIQYKNPFKARESIMNRQYEKLYNFVPRNSIVFDIGAYIGDYALIWAKLYGNKVYAFEADLENYKELKDNITLNELGNQVIPYYSFLGDGNKANYKKSGDYVMVGNSNTETAVRLDDIGILDIPDLIKIDIEGFEYSVLKGMSHTLSRVNKLIIETHSKELRKLCFDYLTANGMRYITSFNNDTSIFNSNEEITMNYYMRNFNSL